MKYIVIEIQKFDEQSMSTPAYSYDTQNAAEAKYHTILAAAAGSQLPVHAALMVNEEGYPLRHECYRHEVAPEPEPEPEGEN